MLAVASSLFKFMEEILLLIVFAGLPGTGKTTVAREVVARLPSVFLRMDIIEQALRKGTGREDVGASGYLVAYELAKSNLLLGMAVVVDCVNPLSVTRRAWRGIADSTSSRLLEVEVVCSDLAEHRRRVEGRGSDIPDFTPPAWEAVLRHEYDVWTTSRFVVDSASVSASEAAEQILQKSLDQPERL